MDFSPNQPRQEPAILVNEMAVNLPGEATSNDQKRLACDGGQTPAELDLDSRTLGRADSGNLNAPYEELHHEDKPPLHRIRSHRLRRQKSIFSVGGGQTLDLAWHAVDVILPASEKLKRPQRTILKTVNGQLNHGELMAVMGASGAGKTTFLNLLSGRMSASLQVTGTISLNGCPVTSNDIKEVSAYVQQEDLFLPNITVKEHLTCQALLRMDNRSTKAERLLAVNDIMHQLGLTKAANNRIGSRIGKRGLSGGEKKRLAFATELLRDPPILFVDEPTSGLDSFSAQSVVKVLHDLADKGHSVLCTIHQPPSDTFNCFNRLLLLAEGRTAYLGPLEGALTFFSELGYPCPNNYNPADHYINVLAIRPGKEEKSKEVVKDITDAYAEKEKRLNLNKPPKTTNDSGLRKEIRQMTEFHHEGVWRQFTTITWRSWLNITRDPIVMLLNLCQAFVIAVMIGLIFFQVQDDSSGKRVQNIVGAVFVILVENSFVAALTVAQIFPSLYPLFIREDDNRMYKRWIYIASDTVANLPIQIVFPLIYISITYFLVGFQVSAGQFFIAAITLILVVFAGQSVGYCISVGSPDVPVAITLVTPVVIPPMMFAGLFLNAESTPYYFIWIEKISWFKYAFDAYMINEWKGMTLGSCPVPDVNATCAGVSCYETGLQVLNSYGLGTSNADLSADIGILFALAVGYRLLAYGILCIRLWLRSRRR